MTVGLDLGSFQFRSLRSNGSELVARCCPAVYTALGDTPSHRRLFQQSKTNFATCSDQLLLFGDAALEWSAMLNLTLLPLLRGGRIPTSDAVSRQILTVMIDSLLPAPVKPNTVCKMTVPGGSYDERVENRDADFFQQLVALRGYRPQLITATLALALSELSAASFTGIAITLGHTTCEFGVIHCGRELARCVVMNGMESFDESPRLGGHAVPLAPLAMSTSVERDYHRFLLDVIREASIQFESDGTMATLPRPLPVVCSGGITSEPSFKDLFQKAWDEANWSVATCPIRIAMAPNLAIVRGCLIQAELDRPDEQLAA